MFNCAIVRRLAIIGGLLLALVILAGTAWVVQAALAASAQADAAIDHTYRVMHQLDTTMAMLDDAETGQRGFIITGDETYLAPYYEAIGRIDGALTSLKTLVKTNPEQAKRADVLAVLVQARLGRITQGIEVRRTSGPEGVAAQIRAGQGRTLMEQIRRVIADAQTQEKYLLNTRTAERAMRDRLVAQAQVGGSIVAGLLLATVFAVLWRENTRRVRAQADLIEHQQHLEETVKIRTAQLETEIAARKEADRAQDRLATIVASSEDAIISKDPDGTIRTWNEGAHRMFGYSEKEMVGQPMARLLPPEEVDDEARTLDRLRLGERSENYDALRLTKDGSAIHVSIIVSPLKDRDGNVIGASTILRNIGERKQAEESLRLSEEKFAKAFAGNPAAICLTRLEDGTFLEVNDTWIALSGCTREQVIGRRSKDMPFWSTATARSRFVRELRAKGSLSGWEQVFRKMSGEPYVAQVSAQILDVRGEKLILTSFVDITDRKRAEESLRESETRFRALTNATSEALYRMSPDWTEMRELHSRGFLANTQGPSRTWFDEYIPPEARRHVTAAIQRAAQEKSVFELEHRIRRADGSLGWTFSRAVPLLDANGQVTEWFGAASDITERVEMQFELEAARLSSEQANQAKDHFLAVLSHELRTPLTAVLPALEELAELAPEAAREAVEMALRNVELEARLIDDLLDVTRISRGKIELQRRPVELRTVIQRAAEVCTPDIEARHLHFGINVDDGPYFVDADPARLQQVFWNLIKNAVKFTPHGGCVGIACFGDGDGHVVAQVKDSGLGIEPTSLPRIFNAFEQADPTVARQFGGLGLGLAISKALVELHGGSLQAQSEGKGKGATFTVRLPLRKPVDQELPGARPAQPAVGARAPARALRILLVEDHGDTSRIMSRMLQSKGHKVATAGDVATALELARGESFDLLISDLGLPDRSGLDLIQELRHSGRHLPGIALSGYGREEDIRRSHEAGFTEHLTKPVNVRQLEVVIARVTGASGSGQ